MTHPIFKCRDLADVKKAVAEYNVEALSGLVEQKITLV